jgi:hypothetical protein
MALAHFVALFLFLSLLFSLFLRGLLFMGAGHYPEATILSRFPTYTGFCNQHYKCDQLGYSSALTPSQSLLMTSYTLSDLTYSLEEQSHL